MKLFKKIVIQILLLTCLSVQANDEIKIIMPYAPGGATDNAGRVIQRALESDLNRNVVVEYKLGSGGAIATAHALAAPKSEKILLLDAIGMITNRIKNPTPLESFGLVHVASIGVVQSVLVVPAKSKIKTYNDFLNESNKAPLSFGSAGIASVSHLIPTVVGHKLDRTFIHIPYKGQAEVMPGLINGDLEFGIIHWTTVMPFIKNNTVIPLAVTSTKRLPQLKNVPTFTEKNISGLNTYGEISVFTNQTFGSADYTMLSDAIKRILKDAKVVAALEETGLDMSNLKFNDPDFIINSKIRLEKDLKNTKLFN